MAHRTVAVAFSAGLHARPAMLFTKAVAAAGIPVALTAKGGNPVDVSSILLVMSLGIGHGEEVTLEADGEHAEGVLDELVELLTTDHDGAEIH
jgi:phosphocarrier protein HPr